MIERKRFFVSLMLVSLAVWLVPALGPVNISIGLILIGVELWRENA